MTGGTKYNGGNSMILFSVRSSLVVCLFFQLVGPPVRLFRFFSAFYRSLVFFSTFYSVFFCFSIFKIFFSSYFFIFLHFSSFFLILSHFVSFFLIFLLFFPSSLHVLSFLHAARSCNITDPTLFLQPSCSVII